VECLFPKLNIVLEVRKELYVAQYTEIVAVIKMCFLLPFLFLKYFGFGNLCIGLVSGRYLIFPCCTQNMVLQGDEFQK